MGEKLKIKKVFSEVKPVSLPEVPNMTGLQAWVARESGIDSGCVVAYLDYGVLVGVFCEGAFCFRDSASFEPRFLQKLRVFNRERELLAWRAGGAGLKGRLRVDKPCDRDEAEGVVKCIDAAQYLWGETAEPHDDWLILREKRGITVTVPVKDGAGLGRKTKVRLLLRNYIDYVPETGQAGYSDCRMTGFEIV